MKKKNKLKAAAVGAVITIGIYMVSGDDVAETPQAPEGYVYDLSNQLVPDIQIKLMTKKVRPLLNSMLNDNSRELAEFAIGYKFFVKDFYVRSDVLNKRAFIEYVTSDQESVRLQPQGIFTGIQYSGDSNMDRTAFDEAAFGFLAKWLGTKNPDEISDAVFGNAVNKDIAFPLAILYFQRQFFEQTELKGFGSASGYSPIFADYSYLYDEYISKGQPFESDVLEKVAEKVNTNIIAITKYLHEIDKLGQERVNEKAVLLLEFYLNEDIKMLKSLERDLKIISPPDNAEKEDARLQRLEQEVRMKQMAENERNLAERKSSRIPTSTRQQ